MDAATIKELAELAYVIITSLAAVIGAIRALQKKTPTHPDAP